MISITHATKPSYLFTHYFLESLLSGFWFGYVLRGVSSLDQGEKNLASNHEHRMLSHATSPIAQDVSFDGNEEAMLFSQTALENISFERLSDDGRLTPACREILQLNSEETARIETLMETYRVKCEDSREIKRTLEMDGRILQVNRDWHPTEQTHALTRQLESDLADLVGKVRAGVLRQAGNEFGARKWIRLNPSDTDSLSVCTSVLIEGREYSAVQRSFINLPIPEEFQDVLEGVELPEKFQFVFGRE